MDCVVIRPQVASIVAYIVSNVLFYLITGFSIFCVSFTSCRSHILMFLFQNTM